jgi:hypothetical protein
VNGRSDVNVGPAFTARDGHLVCGYSVSETDSWAVADGVNAADLERALAAMRRASEPGSRHFAQVTLETGQALVLDNTRLSHGRTSYRNSDTYQRCLYRGLFLRYPSRSSSTKNVRGERRSIQ